MWDRNRNDFLAESKRREKERESGKRVPYDKFLFKPIGRKMRELALGLNAIFVLDEVDCKASFLNRKMIFDFGGSAFYGNYFCATVDSACMSMTIECTDIKSDKIEKLLSDYSSNLRRDRKEEEQQLMFSHLYARFRLVNLQKILDSTVLTDIFLVFAEELAADYKRKKDNFDGMFGGYARNMYQTMRIHPKPVMIDYNSGIFSGKTSYSDLKTTADNMAKLARAQFAVRGRPMNVAEVDSDLNVSDEAKINIKEGVLERYEKLIMVDLESNLSDHFGKGI